TQKAAHWAACLIFIVLPLEQSCLKMRQDLWKFWPFCCARPIFLADCSISANNRPAGSVDVALHEGDLDPAPALQRAENAGAVASNYPPPCVVQSLLEALESRANIR